MNTTKMIYQHKEVPKIKEQINKQATEFGEK
jgi:hypothetical protein